MQVKYERCCGIDVHKQTVVACVIVPGLDGQPQKETRTFSTLTGELTALAQWLTAKGCTHVAMESTGVYCPTGIPLGEADLQFAGRAVRDSGRERGPHQEVWRQDRCHGCRMDRRLVLKDGL
jgi:transposase